MLDIKVDTRNFEKFMNTKLQRDKVILQTALNTLVDNVADKSQERVPSKGGALKESMVIVPLGVDAKMISYTEDYALQVHEEPQQLRNSGERKYLERSLDEEFVVGLKAVTDAIIKG